MIYLKGLAIIIIAFFIGYIILNETTKNDFKHRKKSFENKILNFKNTESNNFFTESDFKSLPSPVRRYFHYSLPKNGKFIKVAFIKQSGLLKTSYQEKKWMKFKASQMLSPTLNGFIWEANVSTPIGFPIKVIDSFIDNIGSGQVWLSFICLDSDEDNTPMNLGSMVRLLAESVWIPTSLLPSEKISWAEINENQARLRMQIDNLSTSLNITFTPQGQIEKIYAPSRYRKNKETYTKTPWQINLKNYQEHNGIKIPIEAEVGWVIDEKLEIVWKGNIDSIEYQF